MKKFLSFLLSAMLLLSVSSTAFAATPVFQSTIDALAALDAKDINYDLYGLDSDGDELVIIPNGDNEIGAEYDLYCFFDQNEENCYIYVWNLITFADADYLPVLQLCNQINDDYRFVTFTVDTSDNTVYVTSDLIYRDNDVGEIFWEAVLHVVNIIHDAYPMLVPYNK